MKRITAKLGEGYRWIVQPLLVLLVIVFGFLGARGLSSQATPPKRVEDRVYAPLVRVMTSEVTNTPVEIKSNGTLRARTNVQIMPQVGGRVIEIHPGFRSGGSFQAGEVLLRIEPRDYELQVARSRADVSSAATQLSTLNAEAEAAREEWRLLNGDTPVPTLVGKEPQLLEAQARIAAAQASLESSELDLERTAISLPWNGRILKAQADVGAVVTPNQMIGAAYATDTFELSASLRQEQMQWIRLPGETSVPEAIPGKKENITILVEYPGADSETIAKELTEPLEWAAQPLEGLMGFTSKSGAGQSLVTIKTTGEFGRKQTIDRLMESLDTLGTFPPEGAGPVQILVGDIPTQVDVQVDISGQLIELPGRVVRMGGELGSMSRFAEVVLEVDLASVNPELHQRLLPGLFAKATLQGRMLSEVTGIPRSSLRENGVVWTIEDERIVFTNPLVIYTDEDRVWVRGLRNGSSVVISNLDVVLEGMQVRMVRENQLKWEESEDSSNGTVSQ
ncbi:MAG: multidrug efflux pump subunit AcrA (membrane-fusion protein) [Glaciecola sp.]|jgi:multidrug efflux pump subunit AcrA (membrane-fusion protein)